MAKSSKTRRPYGSGSIRNLGDGKWEAIATSGRRSDGKRRTKSRVVHGDRADAEAELVRLRVEMGADPCVGDSMTLDEYFWGVWLPTREASLAANPDEPLVARGTVDTYVSLYRNHIGPAFGSWDADRIDEPAVMRWAVRLPSAAMADKAVRHLRAILRCMWYERIIPDKPLERRVRLPRHQADPKEVWTVGELIEACGRLRGHHLEALVLAIAGGGLRREEALALDPQADFEWRVDGEGHLQCGFTVRRAWVDGADRLKPTKTYQVRPVTVGEPFAPRLMEVCADGRPRLAMRRDGTGPLAPSSIPETWRRAFAGGPLRGMRFTELRLLRHLHETMASASGFSDSANASLHGHSQQVMYENYLSVSSATADRLAEAIRVILAGADVG